MNQAPQSITKPDFPPIDVGTVAQAIEKVFQVLEPWFAVKCDVSDFVDFVEYIQLQGRKFASAVDLSVKTSADGIALARDSLVFCSAIEGGWDEKTINEFFRGLLKIATSAYGRARVCEEHFRDIRSNIARISNHVPKTIREVTEQLTRTDASSSRVIKLQKGCQLAAGALEKATESSLVAGVVLLTAFPPAGIILPIALPALRLIASGAGYICERNLEKRRCERLTLVDARNRFKSLEGELECIHSCLRQIADWWMDIKNKLHKMEEILERQGISYYQDITTRSAVRKSWSDIQERYRTYLSEITAIQDHYQLQCVIEEMDVGFKGELLSLQRDVEAFRDGLIELEDVSSIIRGGYHQKLRQSLRSVETSFVRQLEAMMDCLKRLGRRGDDDNLMTKILGYNHTMCKTLQHLLKQDNLNTRIISAKLCNVRRIIDKECSRTKAVLDNLKLRTNGSGVTKESSLQLVDRMEERARNITSFCINLAMNGPWREGEIVVERNLGPSFTKALDALEYTKERLELLRSAGE